MTSCRLIIEGIGGLLAGEHRALHPGQEILVGRSRNCGLSAANTPAAHAIGRDTLQRSPTFQKLSRHHLRIHFLGNGRSVEIEDLSTNGLLLNGRHVSKTVLTLDRIAHNSVIVRLGDGEKLRLHVKAFVNESNPVPRNSG